MSESEPTEHQEIQNSPNLLPFRFARQYGVLLDRRNGAVVALHKDKLALSTIAEVQRFTGESPQFKQVEESEFDDALSDVYSADTTDTRQMVADLGDAVDLARLADSVPENSDLLEREEDAPVIRLINALLSEALRENASDIHIETFETMVQVRFRVDGVLREVVTPKRALAPLIVSRIKVMSKLDIAEKRVPQDGRTSIRIGGREIDVRVSVLPTGSGERVVLRLLDKQASRLSLPNLGMNSSTLAGIQQLVASPHGILLVTGPTGSGKTTTLYASLSELQTEELNVLTVEDPIEYNLHGIGQTQVNNRTGMTFAKGLRAILRQDPDIVMVGEIRDLETAEIGIQASLTGHLVLSTLHTNTAAGTITRMMDMGVEPYLLATSLVGVLAQRLVRVLCQHCRAPREPTMFETDFLHQQVDHLFDAVGCEECNKTGYRGRTGIYELITLDNEIRQLVHDRSSEQSLADYAHRSTPSIREDGIEKVIAGTTTIHEVLRVTLEA